MKKHLKFKLILIVTLLIVLVLFVCCKGMQTYTLKYLAETGGEIKGTSNQQVRSGKNGSTVVATPNTGYFFAGWSDGIAVAERADINIKADITVTAKFNKKTFILTYAA